MAAATVSSAPEPRGALAEEVVVLEASTNETYTTNLSSIEGVVVGVNNSGGGTPVVAEFVTGGTTIIFRGGGVNSALNTAGTGVTSTNTFTDQQITLIIKGRL